uniref:Uncharacterized protein n=1 Tax=Arundo donax TaxID=35708 RepID=A0A0A9FT13_ARUDO
MLSRERVLSKMNSIFLLMKHSLLLQLHLFLPMFGGNDFPKFLSVDPSFSCHLESPYNKI